MNRSTHLYLYSITLVFSILCYSCEPNVYFENTMPPNTESLTEIPFEFQGAYLCESDSNVVYSDAHFIYLESHDHFVTSLDEINQTENCAIIDGDLYLPNHKECVPFEYLDGDRISATIVSIDTLFAFSKNEVAKLYKGRLFLNIRGETDNNWITFMITPQDHGTLLWEMIEIPDELKTLKNLTNKYKKKEYRDHDTKYIINPTLIEFQEFLDKEYTLTCDYLIPINIEEWQ